MYHVRSLERHPDGVDDVINCEVDPTSHQPMVEYVSGYYMGCFFDLALSEVDFEFLPLWLFVVGSIFIGSLQCDNTPNEHVPSKRPAEKVLLYYSFMLEHVVPWPRRLCLRSRSIPVAAKLSHREQRLSIPPTTLPRIGACILCSP